MSFQEVIKIGSLRLRNRIVMAAMTRQRAGPTGVPNELMVEYYKQRAGAGLIITEGTQISESSGGDPGAARLYNQQQADGWKRVIHAVKKQDGNIFLQLYHVGRRASQTTTGGFPTIGPSPIAPRGKVRSTEQLYSVPRQMTYDDIKRVKDDFVRSMRLAKTVGFDGIQLHCASGFLLDNFLRSFSNIRKDSYGGRQLLCQLSAENRCRFPLEIVDAALKEWKSERISVKMTPVGREGDMFDANPLETYSHFIKQLDRRKISFIQIVRSSGETSFDHEKPERQLPDIIPTLGKKFSGIVVANMGYDETTGLKQIDRGNADMISYGQLYISNPDLAERLINKWPINKNIDWKTVYTPGAKGYTDYPFSPMNKQQVQ